MINAVDPSFPEMALVRQQLCHAPVKDVAGAVSAALAGSESLSRASAGASVAVAVGSRGIHAIDTIVRTCVDGLKDKGLNPLIVPAMGSHGGATPEGQTAVLAGYGITESAMGAPIVADMETDSVGTLSCGMDVFFSRAALAADWILPVNRIKPHTKFTGPIESGLAKMLAVGAGKADGAAEIHRYAVNHTFAVIEAAAAMILGKCPVLCGLGILEDGYGNTARVAAVSPETLLADEKVLLAKAYEMLPRIAFDHVDILVVDRIGKDISGIGMDSNVTGRHRDITGNFYIHPHVKRIFVRDLSPGSAGNANGIGLADFTTNRLACSVDREKTFKNALIAISPEKAAMPMAFECDRDALIACARSCGLPGLADARIIRIQSTAHLERFFVSRAFEAELAAAVNVSMETQWVPLRFDEDGNFADFFSQ
ncbi:MAG: lactate racemase domain-containing protein [Thermodesulfobacteriota bacterium]|nr:lactate racemase domain-containing protein [Thermodesulfobacteriota bacterium]